MLFKSPCCYYHSLRLDCHSLCKGWENLNRNTAWAVIFLQIFDLKGCQVFLSIFIFQMNFDWDTFISPGSMYMPVSDWWLTFHNGLKPSWNHEMFFKIYLARDGERTLQDTIMNTVYRKQLNTNPLWLDILERYEYSIRKDFTPFCFVLLPSSWWFALLAKLLNASSTTAYSTTFL